MNYTQSRCIIFYYIILIYAFESNITNRKSHRAPNYKIVYVIKLPCMLKWHLLPKLFFYFLNVYTYIINTYLILFSVIFINIYLY